MIEDNGFPGTREEVERAIRRLNLLEYLILAAAFILALVGGGAVAYVLSAGTSLPFRLTWAILTLLLLVVPGVLVFGRDHLRRQVRLQDGDKDSSDHR